MSIKMIVTINEKFCYLVNKNVYEELICDLMNRSNNVFPGKYERVMRQCSSQCDFVEVETGIKFDAKLPFEEIHGRLIGSRNRDYEKWLSLMMKQEAEYGEDIVKTRGQNVVSTELYKILEKRLATIKDDEHAIFFFPYPIGLDSKYTELGSVVSDFLDAIFRELNAMNRIGMRKVYAIYPSVDGDIVLRCLNNRNREYIHFTELDKYLSYVFKE